MNLIYSSNPRGNFGDDLNPYIFNYFFKDLFEDQNTKNIDFYGIGTIIGSQGILSKEVDSDVKNVFFGSGVRNLSMKYNSDNWDIRFVRGPISSNILGLKNEKYITDSAYAYALMPEYQKILEEKKKYKFSFMPHLSHTQNIDWNKIGQKLDIHIISPHQEASKSLKEISQTEYLIGGAMHGAIMADVLRVPFVRLRMEAINSEDFLTSDMKWLDWLSSVNMNDSSVYVKNIYLNNNGLKNKVRYIFFMKELESKLKYIKNSTNLFQLSENKVFEQKLKEIDIEINKFKEEYSHFIK